MRLRTIFALMIVFIVLGTFAFFDPLHRQEKKEAAAERASHVFAFEGKRFDALTVRNHNGVFTFACARAEGCAPDGSADWKLTAPVADLADGSVLGSLTATLKNLTHVDKLDFENTAPDPQEFGFAESGASVELRARGEGEPYRLDLGKNTPVGNNVYALSSRDPHTVFVVANTLYGILQGDLFHWRNKRIFPGAKVEAITELSWTSPKGSFRAERGSAGWQLTQPVAAPANGVMIEGLASTLVYLNAKSIFASDRKEPRATAAFRGKPVLEIQFRSGKDAPAGLKLYPVPGAAAGSPDLLVDSPGLANVPLVEGTPFDRFRKEPGAYRDQRLFPGRDLFGVNKMKLEFPRTKESVTLVRKGDVWTPDGNPKPAQPLSDERIGGLFETMNHAEARDVIPTASPEGRAAVAGTPDVVISLSEGDKPFGEARFVLPAVSPGRPGPRFALSPGADSREVRRYGDELARLLPTRLADLFEANNQKLKHSAEEDHEHEHSHGHAH